MNKTNNKVVTVVLGLVAVISSFLLRSISIVGIFYHLLNALSLIVLFVYLFKLFDRFKQGVAVFSALQSASLLFFFAGILITGMRTLENNATEFNKISICVSILMCSVSILCHIMVFIGALKQNKAINIITFVVLVTSLIFCIAAFFKNFFSTYGLAKYMANIIFSFWLWYKCMADNVHFKIKHKKVKHNVVKSDITLEKLKEKAEKGEISIEEYNKLKKKIIDNL